MGNLELDTLFQRYQRRYVVLIQKVSFEIYLNILGKRVKQKELQKLIPRPTPSSTHPP